MLDPRHSKDHPDYRLELEEALLPLVAAAVEEARMAGWDEAAIWPALRSLATNMELAARENHRTDKAIAAAIDGLAKKH
ncbi:MAG: hypothetical protein H6887_09610 [Hoeflea sp.]|nr:hypothetical protein [Hoeflea sp.]